MIELTICLELPLPWSLSKVVAIEEEVKEEDLQSIQIQQIKASFSTFSSVVDSSSTFFL